MEQIKIARLGPCPNHAPSIKKPWKLGWQVHFQQRLVAVDSARGTTDGEWRARGERRLGVATTPSFA